MVVAVVVVVVVVAVVVVVGVDSRVPAVVVVFLYKLGREVPRHQGS